MKKVYWLALWWWSARWFVHIWVLKYLEEKDVEIWEIAWTSMWAIIWALFAIWKKSFEIQKIANSLNLFFLVDFDFNSWFIKWDLIVDKLKSYFWDILIEDLPIKLSIIATNLDTWEKEVFKKWKLVDAIRASISLPWIFKPHKIWKINYIDWWVVCNLPIDEIELENKIWVSALKIIKWPIKFKKRFLWFEINKSFLNINYNIMYRAFMNMMLLNEKYSIDNSTWNKQILNFEFWDLSITSFSEVDKFVEIWYLWAKKDLKFV